MWRLLKIKPLFTCADVSSNVISFQLEYSITLQINVCISLQRYFNEKVHFCWMTLNMIGMRGIWDGERRRESVNQWKGRWGVEVRRAMFLFSVFPVQVSAGE